MILELKEMKKQIFLKASLLLVAGMLAACSSNDDNIEDDGTKGGKKVDVAKTVEFNVEFADYNSDKEVPSRAACDQANDTLYKKLVKVSDKILAEVTVKRDAPNTMPLAKTRALEDGIYTMIAYQGTTYKGETTGTISSGVFHYLGNKALDLEPGTYTFVLCNDKVGRNGNDITVTAANAATALIGRTTYTVPPTPAHQKVTFTMKHVCARIRYKLTSYMPILKPAMSYDTSKPIPTSSVYHPGTDTWTATTTAMEEHPLTCSGGTKADDNDFYNAYCDYVYLLMPTVASNKISFDLGDENTTTYNGQKFRFPAKWLPASLPLTPNSSYTFTFKLFYRFLYLYQDGNILDASYVMPNYKPIAVIVSQSKHLAVALENANNGQDVKWYHTDNHVNNMNNVYYVLNVNLGSSYGDMLGYHYTWEVNTGFDNTTRKGDNQTDFPAFYYAGHYGDELAAKHITVTGPIAGKKWHLPSNGEFALLYYNLGFGEPLNKMYLSTYRWHEKLANLAFTQVGANPIFADWQDDYWTSTEMRTYAVQGYCAGHVVHEGNWQLRWTWYPKHETHCRVRPFIYYK